MLACLVCGVSACTCTTIYDRLLLACGVDCDQGWSGVRAAKVQPTQPCMVEWVELMAC